MPVLDQAALRAFFRFDISPFQLHVLMGIVFGNFNEDARIVLGADTHGANLPNLPISFDGLRVDAKRQLDQLRAAVTVVIVLNCHELSRPLLRATGAIHMQLRLRFICS